MFIIISVEDVFSHWTWNSHHRHTTTSLSRRLNSHLSKVHAIRIHIEQNILKIKEKKKRLECSPLARETWVQSQVESYQRLKKWYLMRPCLTLSIIRYGSRVKWSNPGKGVALSPTPWCSKLSKREPSGHPRLWSTMDNINNAKIIYKITIKTVNKSSKQLSSKIKNLL